MKKSLYYLSLLLAIILFSFLLFHVIPSDPARIILGPNADERQVSSLRKELGLDKPSYLQLLAYLERLLHFDLGKSFVDKRPVLGEVTNRLIVSLALIFFCVLFILLYLLFIMQTLSFNWITRKINFLFISTPSFFSGLIVALFFVRYLPGYSFSSSVRDARDFVSFLPPAFVLALYPMGILSRILMTEMQEILNSQYIITAKAFALSTKIILYKYALRNAIIPCMAAFSNQLPALFTGAFIIEIMFSIPGIGTLLVKSILERDFPMLEGIIISNGLIFILTNLLFETLYPFIDPRIEKNEGHS